MHERKMYVEDEDYDVRLQITAGHRTFVWQIPVNLGFDRQKLSLVGPPDRAFLLEALE